MIRILAIDDDEGILFTLGAVARLAGWDLRGFQNPQAGVKAFQAERYDLALVDYHMPAMDGVSVVRELRKSASGVPIVVLTVDDRMELADQFVAAGASDFAVKPIKAPDLISRLRLHLQTRPPVSVELPKGISEQTLDMVTRFVLETGRPVSAEDVSSELGLAYQTASRYLEHLSTSGHIQVRLEYLQRGRPRKLYCPC